MNENRINWFELQQICDRTGLSVNLEALIGKQDKCKHEIAIPTRFEAVSPNYQIAEVVCVKCGKIVGLLARKALPQLSFLNLSQNKSENEKEVE